MTLKSEVKSELKSELMSQETQYKKLSNSTYENKQIIL